MNRYNYKIRNEGITLNVFNLIVELLEDYTFDAQYLDDDTEKKLFNEDLNNTFKNLKMLVRG